MIQNQSSVPFQIFKTKQNFLSTFSSCFDSDRICELNCEVSVINVI